MLTQQHTGVKDEKLGNIYITSKAYEDMMAGKMRVEYAKHLGTLENGIISFPKESVGVKLPEYQQDYIWWVNTSKCFGLTLPVSGIKDIEYGQQAAPRQPKSVFRHHKIQLCVRFDAELNLHTSIWFLNGLFPLRIGREPTFAHAFSLLIHLFDAPEATERGHS